MPDQDDAFEKQFYPDLNTRDSLSGCLHLKAFDQRLRKFLSDGGRENKAEFQIFFTVFDIPGLKKLVDSQSFSAGDEKIKETGTLLLENYKEDDVFRVGGDEFLVWHRKVTPIIWAENLKYSHLKIEGQSNPSIESGHFQHASIAYYVKLGIHFSKLDGRVISCVPLKGPPIFQ